MKKLDLWDHVQSAPFTWLHLRIAVIAFALITLDGYDVAIYGTITPFLMEDWNLDAVTAGLYGSAGLAGMAVGAVTFGALADRFGRKRVIIITVLFYSVFTAASGIVSNGALFAIFRFIAGLGLGGVMPSTIAMLKDFIPRAVAATVVTAVLSGFSVGGLLAPVLGIWIIPALGWRTALIVAILALALVPFAHRVLPESFSALIRTGQRERMIAQVRSLNPTVAIADDVQFQLPEKPKSKLPLVDLFQQRRGAATLLFWLAMFAQLLLAYGLLNWLPKIMAENGHTMVSSLTFLAAFQLGGVVGTLVAGRIADKIGLRIMVIALYILETLTVAAIGVNSIEIITYLLVVISGATVTAVQNVLQVYVAEFYPVYTRSTALGSASSVGRVGAMLGPVIGGVLLAANAPMHTIFLTLAIPGIIAALAIFAVREKHSFQYQLNHSSAPAPEPELAK